jgi:glucose-6-phosphate isomerase
MRLDAIAAQRLPGGSAFRPHTFVGHWLNRRAAIGRLEGGEHVKDLSAWAGLPLYLEGSALVFGGALRDFSAARTRRVDTLAGLWRNPQVRGDQEVYSTYLRVWKPEHQELFDRWNLDHGYVVMSPGLYGREYSKQYGHYHAPAAGTTLSYPEVYAVLHGAGLFLLQESLPPYDEVTDVVVVEAKAGDNFLVPPNYGHLTINPGDSVLVFEGFLYRDLEALYEPYKQRRGGAYYAMVGDDGALHWIANERYGQVPVLREIGADQVSAGQGLGARACYEQFVERPAEFRFLIEPREFRPEWRF